LSSSDTRCDPCSENVQRRIDHHLRRDRLRTKCIYHSSDSLLGNLHGVFVWRMLLCHSSLPVPRHAVPCSNHPTASLG
jgi:hypothetical protein